MAWVDTKTAIERMDGILSEAHSSGIIEEYGRCTGVPSFDVETLDGEWFQITVRGDE